MKKFYVYYHRDPRKEYKNWKRYIGKGSKNRANNFSNRYAKHKNWIKHLESLGLEPIVEIVEYFEKEKDAFDREIELIKKYKEKGYDLCNTAEGGKGGPSLSGEESYWFGKKRSKETKQKISKSRKNKYAGNKNPFFGKKHSKKAKEKMSVSKKITSKGNKNKLGKKHSAEFKNNCKKRMEGNNYRSKPIKCLNNNTVYKSIKEACEQLKLDNRSVHRMLKGEYKHTKGYKFDYFLSL